MFFLLSLVACFFERNEEVAVPYCEETPEIINVADEFEDFSWQNWLDSLGENGQVSGDSAILWEDSGADCLTWQFIPDENTAAYINSELVTPEADAIAQIYVECFDSVEISGSLSLQSGDGRINETIPAKMRRYFGGEYGTEVQTSLEIEPSDWRGSLDISSFETNSSFDSQSLLLILGVGDDGLSGEFHLQTEGATEDAVWVSGTMIAEFNGECPEIAE